MMEDFTIYTDASFLVHWLQNSLSVTLQSNHHWTFATFTKHNTLGLNISELKHLYNLRFQDPNPQL